MNRRDDDVRNINPDDFPWEGTWHKKATFFDAVMLKYKAILAIYNCVW